MIEIFYIKNEEVIKNPTDKDFNDKLSQCKVVKGFKHQDSFYIWDAHKLTHYDVQLGLHLQNENKHLTIFNYYRDKNNLPFHSFADFAIDYKTRILIFDSLGDYDFGDYRYASTLLNERKELLRETQSIAKELCDRLSLTVDKENLKLFEFFNNYKER